ncbi:MAG: multidrug effflux MFS transporter [Thermomicrobiales bacterium]
MTEAALPASSTNATKVTTALSVVLLLGALNAMGPLSIDMYLPALPALQRDFGAGASAAQLTLSACLVGLALGQVIMGPLSDRFGRRQPLLVGIAGFAIVSLACAIAPSIYLLILLRFMQGLTGSAGIVIARAIVRDLYSGVAAARFFSMLMLVTGTAPILAPILGGQLLHFVDWQGIFIIIGLAGVILFIAAATRFEETLPVSKRQTGGLSEMVHVFKRLLGDRVFVGYALGGGIAYGTIFSYIAGSTFVLQDIYGLSAQQYSLVFAVNSIGLVANGQLNGRFLIGRVPMTSLMTIGILGLMLGSTLFLIAVATGSGLWFILPALFLIPSSMGMIIPNAMALGMSRHPQTAGSSAALMGVLQYAIGAVLAPIVGLFGEDTAYPMAILMIVAATTALATYFFFARRGTGLVLEG